MFYGDRTEFLTEAAYILDHTWDGNTIEADTETGQELQQEISKSIAGFVSVSIAVQFLQPKAGVPVHGTTNGNKLRVAITRATKTFLADVGISCNNEQIATYAAEAAARFNLKFPANLAEVAVIDKLIEAE